MATIVLELTDLPDGMMRLRTWSSADRDPWDLNITDRTSAEIYATCARNAIRDLQNMAADADLINP